MFSDVKLSADFTSKQWNEITRVNIYIYYLRKENSFLL